MANVSTEVRNLLEAIEKYPNFINLEYSYNIESNAQRFNVTIRGKVKFEITKIQNELFSTFSWLNKYEKELIWNALIHLQTHKKLHRSLEEKEELNKTLKELSCTNL